NVLFSQLQDLETEKLIRLEAPDPKWEYAFRNVITQEVVYEGLLLAQRRQLHTDIGQVLEKLVPEEIERLAFHYSRSNDFQKGMYYLHLATERARREYANQAAVSYLDEMLNLIANPPIEEQSNEPSSPPPNVTNQTNGYLQTYQTGLYSTTYWDFLLERSQLYNLLGQREEEAEDLGTLGVLAEALQDTRRRALAARQWSQYYEAAGDYASGLETVERAVQLAEETEDQQFVGEIYSSWGKMLFLSGDYTLASTQLQHATEIAQDYHDEVAQADSLYNQGIIHFFQAHYDEALTYFQQAVDLWKKLNDQVNLGKGLRELGRSYFQLGQLMAAQEHLERALTLMRKIHDSVSAAITQNYAGQVETRLGNYLIAEALFTSAQKVHQETENQSAAAESKAYLGFLYSRQGNHERAITTLEEALETIRELEDTWALSTALTYYGWALIEAGDPHSAQLFLQEVLQIERDVKPGIDEAKIMEVLVLLGRTALARNDLSLASTCSRHALAHLNTHGTKGFEYPVRVYLTVYEMLMALDKEAQAKDILCEVSAFINTQAEQITDPGLRERFLTRVPEIRDVRSLIDEV
ncbi:MAG: tetratricopeptide repeat protein, partial [Chloroflexota bacterium]